mmetsp:Transcript_19829/g.55264  ORF Transcript_19829/g.55264 Transcript_19829/m.55264 type:complete len:312 (-) Transcript_19829:72-1007(-)
MTASAARELGALLRGAKKGFVVIVAATAFVLLLLLLWMGLGGTGLQRGRKNEWVGIGGCCGASVPVGGARGTAEHDDDEEDCVLNSAAAGDPPSSSPHSTDDFQRLMRDRAEARSAPFSSSFASSLFGCLHCCLRPCLTSFTSVLPMPVLWRMESVTSTVSRRRSRSLASSCQGLPSSSSVSSSSSSMVLLVRLKSLSLRRATMLESRSWMACTRAIAVASEGCKVDERTTFVLGLVWDSEGHTSSRSFKLFSREGFGFDFDFDLPLAFGFVGVMMGEGGLTIDSSDWESAASVATVPAAGGTVLVFLPRK